MPIVGAHNLGRPRRETIEELSRTDSLTSSQRPTNEGRLLFSYDPACQELAKALHRDLTIAGYDVYPLATGDDDEEYVQKGIQWARQDEVAKLVLFITSASVGRPNGVSLNHVSAAMNAGMGFVPLMVRHCEIPLSICRIQWFDMTDCIVDDATQSVWKLNETRYQPKVEGVVRALSEGLDHTGEKARMFALMSPFSFSAQVR